MEELPCPCNSSPGIAILLHEIFGTCPYKVFRETICFFFLYSGIAVQAKCICSSMCTTREQVQVLQGCKKVQRQHYLSICQLIGFLVSFVIHAELNPASWQHVAAHRVA